MAMIDVNYPDRNSLLTFNGALKRSGLDRDEFITDIGAGKIKCGIFAGPWEGIAIPSLDDDNVEWVCRGRRRLNHYVYIERNSGVVRELCVFPVTMLFWYLFGDDARNVLINGNSKISWLLPFNGSNLHKLNPRVFQEDKFIVLLTCDQNVKPVNLVFI